MGLFCFQRVEVELTIDARRRLLDRRISGGEFLEAEARPAEQDHISNPADGLFGRDSHVFRSPVSQPPGEQMVHGI
jgi:hypothetical protein